MHADLKKKGESGTSLPIWKEAARAQSCQARLGVPVHAEGMRQVARSPKRSSHEDSDVQRDVNIRVHEGAIDSVAMRMIMFKKESEWEFGSRCVVLVESDLELLVTRRSSVKLRHCMVSVCSWAGLISNRLLCFTHRSFN